MEMIADCRLRFEENPGYLDAVVAFIIIQVYHRLVLCGQVHDNAEHLVEYYVVVSMEMLAGLPVSPLAPPVPRTFLHRLVAVLISQAFSCSSFSKGVPALMSLQKVSWTMSSVSAAFFM